MDEAHASSTDRVVVWCPAARTRPRWRHVHRSGGPQRWPAPPGVRWRSLRVPSWPTSASARRRVAAPGGGAALAGRGHGGRPAQRSAYRRSAGAGGADQLRAASRADVVHRRPRRGGCKGGNATTCTCLRRPAPVGRRWPAWCCTEPATGAVSTSLVVAVCTAWRRRWSSPASSFVSPRPACGILAAAVQQRLTTPGELRVAVTAATRTRHRAALLAALDDIAQGTQALSEIDFVRLCRRHGLPVPTHQAVRVEPSGRRRYLDAEWTLPDGRSAAVEVDGALHLRAAPLVRRPATAERDRARRHGAAALSERRGAQ